MILMGISLEYHGIFMGETLWACWMNGMFMEIFLRFMVYSWECYGDLNGTSRGILNISWDIHANIMEYIYIYPLVN